MYNRLTSDSVNDVITCTVGVTKRSVYTSCCVFLHHLIFFGINLESKCILFHPSHAFSTALTHLVTHCTILCFFAWIFLGHDMLWLVHTRFHQLLMNRNLHLFSLFPICYGCILKVQAPSVRYSSTLHHRLRRYASWTNEIFPIISDWCRLF